MEHFVVVLIRDIKQVQLSVVLGKECWDCIQLEVLLKSEN